MEQWPASKRMMVLLRTVFVLLLAMMSASCASPSAQDPLSQTPSGLPAEGSPVDSSAPASVAPTAAIDAPSQRDQAELNGTWRSREVEGIDLDEDVGVIFTFEGGRFAADIACNRMTGPLAMKDGRLEVVYESTTESAIDCPQPEGSWDRWLLELVTSNPVVDRQGDTMIISGDPGRLVLNRQDPDATVEEDQVTAEDVHAAPRNQGVYPIIDVEVELYHCGFMPIGAARTQWVPVDTPFDATTAPNNWVGRGRLLMGPDGTVYADLSGIEVPMLELIGEFDPPPCA